VQVLLALSVILLVSKHPYISKVSAQAELWATH
jgi:hypothetical protein